jgi:hypothetical protein
MSKGNGNANMEEMWSYPSAILESEVVSQCFSVPLIPIVLRCSFLFLLACVTVYSNNYAHLDGEEVKESPEWEEMIT